jgi:hypothetical protein
MMTRRMIVYVMICMSTTVLMVFFAVAMMPVYVHAQTNIGAAANAMCVPPPARDYSFPCNTPNPITNIPGGLGCPCGVGITTGQCVAPLVCKAVSSGGSPVDQGLQMLGQLLSQALQKLMQGGGGGGGGSPSGGGAGSNFGTGNTPGIGQTCTSYTQVSAPSSNPCEYYVPTGNSNIATDLLKSLGDTNTQTNTTSIQTQGTNGNSGVGALVNPTGSAGAPDSFSSFAHVTGMTPGPNPNQSTGPRGDIRLGPNGATIYASNSATGSNAIVPGFFGADTLGGVQSLGVAAWLCTIRPWNSSFLSNLIPDSFFDGLCKWHGFHVGPLPHPVVPTLTQTPVTKVVTPTRTATSTEPVVPPKVQIWAVPASVSVGSRTSVFWITQGVTNCIETSPDGSFNQSSLSGGASTVPLTTATTFTISCVAPDGTPVTDYFTVRIAI